jgi:hypothetical protein
MPIATQSHTHRSSDPSIYAKNSAYSSHYNIPLDQQATIPIVEARVDFFGSQLPANLETQALPSPGQTQRVAEAERRD